MHIPSGNRYVGQTQRPLDERVSEHFVMEAKHNSSGLTHLWVKHPSPREYIVLPLAHAPQRHLMRLEDKYIDIFNPFLNIGRESAITRERKGRAAPPPRKRERDMQARRPPPQVTRDAAVRLARDAAAKMKKEQGLGRRFLSQLSDAKLKVLKAGLKRMHEEERQILSIPVAEEHRRRAAAEYISIEFASAWLDQDIVKACMQSEEARKLWPWDAQNLRALRFQYRGAPTLGATVFNFSKAATSDEEVIDCGCARFEGINVTRWRGHVVGHADRRYRYQ